MNKGLEALEVIKIYKLFSKGSNTPQYIDLQKCFPKEWGIIEKELKALEIIKECCIVAEYPDTTYELAFCRKICIEKEEYDLLKEVLL